MGVFGMLARNTTSRSLMGTWLLFTFINLIAALVAAGLTAL